MKKMTFAAIISVTCYSAAQAQSNPTSQSIDNAIQELTHNVDNNGNTRAVGSFVSFSSKEDTKGSRYYYNRWVKGSVTGTNGVNINSDSISYNYDKIGKALFITSDMKSMIELDKDQVKSFTLRDGSSAPIIFEKLDIIHPGSYFQVISENPGKISAYKYTQTKFEKSNYRTDGLVETGKNYDEYVDTDEYYIVSPDGVKKIDLTKKSIIKTLGNDKVKTYFSKHGDDDINESFIHGLVEFMNN